MEDLDKTISDTHDEITFQIYDICILCNRFIMDKFKILKCCKTKTHTKCINLWKNINNIKCPKCLK